jgi:hypothetical protein
MNRTVRSLLTALLVCAVLLAGIAGPVSAAPNTADREGDTRTLLATPGGPTDNGSERTTDVTGEIILEEGREMTMPTVSVTITVTIQLPEAAAEPARTSIDINTPKGDVSVIKTKK